jgi:hypothetical protein
VLKEKKLVLTPRKRRAVRKIQNKKRVEDQPKNAKDACLKNESRGAKRRKEIKESKERARRNVPKRVTAVFFLIFNLNGDR